jgi:hypothetical protein
LISEGCFAEKPYVQEQRILPSSGEILGLLKLKMKFQKCQKILLKDAFANEYGERPDYRPDRKTPQSTPATKKESLPVISFNR